MVKICTNFHMLLSKLLNILYTCQSTYKAAGNICEFLVCFISVMQSGKTQLSQQLKPYFCKTKNKKKKVMQPQLQCSIPNLYLKIEELFKFHTYFPTKRNQVFINICHYFSILKKNRNNQDKLQSLVQCTTLKCNDEYWICDELTANFMVQECH